MRSWRRVIRGETPHFDSWPAKPRARLEVA
jgi:hypothetical protein